MKKWMTALFFFWPGATALPAAAAMENCPHHAGGGAHVMPGIPDWLFYSGIAFVLLASFGLVEGFDMRARTKSAFSGFDLMQVRWFKWMVSRPWFQFAAQLPIMALFILVVYAGLAGHPVINIAPILTWTVWWAGLIFIILFLGKTWCTVCPWDMMAGIVQRLKFWGAQKRPLTLGLPWPKALANIYPATILFLFLTWLELGYKVTVSPRYTAYFALGMAALAIVCALVFEKKAFCRYACLVGRVSGLYALFSPVEVRRRDPGVCGSCKTEDCLNGNDRGMPCPTSQSLKTMRANTYCIQCTECVRSCTKDNVAMNVRPFGADLLNYRKERVDEALLALIMLSMTSFHGLTMTPLWDDGMPGPTSVVGWMAQMLGVTRLASFTISMALILAAPFAIYASLTAAARKFAGDDGVPFGSLFINFAYTLLPIALFYHLAHNGMHLFMEGQNIITVASDPLGTGANIFGTAGKLFPPLLKDNVIWILQVILVAIGHIWGIVIGHHAAKKLYKDPKKAVRSLVPITAAMILFSFFSLWIMHLSMNMRGTLM